MKPDYEVLSAPALDALQRLPEMGRVMLTANEAGVTHERMGTVGRVSVNGTHVRIAGDTHDSTIDLSAVKSLAIDRTSKMKDQIYPHLNLIGADGKTVVGIVGMEGLAPFEAGLGDLGRGVAGAPPVRPERPKPELGENDPAEGPLAQAAKKGGTVTVRFRRPGFEQAWTGVIGSVKPAMGFINIIQPDFHLHVRGGAIAGWRAERGEDAVVLSAHDADGKPAGLTLRGGADVLTDGAV